MCWYVVERTRFISVIQSGEPFQKSTEYLVDDELPFGSQLKFKVFAVAATDIFAGGLARVKLDITLEYEARYPLNASIYTADEVFGDSPV